MHRPILRSKSRRFSPAPLFLAALAALGLNACATSSLTIESDPAGAEVYVVTAGDVKQKLGQAPLTVTPAQMPFLFNAESQIQVVKDGYRPESYLLPPQSAGTIGRIQAKLAVDAVSKTCQDSAAAITESTDAVAQVQRLIYRKNYVEAEKALATYIVKYASVPVFHSLLGNVHYLQKNLDRALESYVRASSLQPQNQENVRMIHKIKEIRGSGSN